MKECRICRKEMTPNTVYGGFMGFMYRLFNFSTAKHDYKNFANCQECRDLYASGYTVKELLMMKNKEYRDKMRF